VNLLAGWAVVSLIIAPVWAFTVDKPMGTQGVR
jgi:hypothetical protein